MSFTPARHSFTIWAGATFNPTITAYINESATVVRNLSGHYAEMTIKDVPGGEVLLVIASPDQIKLGGVEGTITPFLTAAETADLEWDAGVYTLTLTDPSGITDALLHGVIGVRQF